MLLMKPSRRCSFDGAGFIISAALAFAAVGCASAPDAIKMEPDLFAEKLGFANCEVSVPLDPDKVAELGRELKIYPNPTEDLEWSKMVAIRQPEDQLRRVSCGSNHISPYVLVRSDEVIFKFDIGFFD